MSMLRRAKDFRDRIKEAQGKQQGGSIRTGIRSVRNAASGRPSAGRGKPKAGINLQYKDLQSHREFEAVLDDIDATSDSVFASTNDRPESAGAGKRSVGGENAEVLADSDPLFPPSDNEEDGSESRERHAVMDPLLGQVLIPETDSGHTDSDESEENFELDAETVKVLESLHQDQDELFDTASSSISMDHKTEGGREKTEGLREGENRKDVGCGGRKTPLAVNNESANNNSKHSLGKVGETLHNEPDITGSPSGATVIQIASSDADSPDQPQTKDRHVCVPSKSIEEASKLSPHTQPSLADLLEHGSAVLRSHSHSPCASPHSSPQELSSSPLTSGNETETNELFYSVTNQLSQVAEPRNSETSSPGKPQGLTNDSKKPTMSKEIGKKDAGKKVGGMRPGSDSLFSDSTAHQLLPVDIDSQKQGGCERRMGGKDELDLSPTSDHPLGHGDEEEEVVKEKHSGQHHAPNSEDELFPDDSKHLQDSVPREKNSAAKSTSALNIRENYFSSSPGEQYKKTALGPTPPSAPGHGSPSRQNSRGKVAPPRPPRSPQLAARLKLRQERETGNQSKTQSSHKPVAVHSPSIPTQTPVVVESTTVKMVQALGSAPASMPTSTPITKLHAQEEEQLQDLELLGSDVDPPALHGQSNPLPTTNIHVAETHATTTTLQNEKDDPFRHWLSSESAAPTTVVGFVEPPFFSLHIHLLIVGILYFYYTFNPFAYLAGLMAGFLTFYLLLGTVFVLYVQNEEKTGAATSPESRAPELSPHFTELMGIRLEDHKKRFMTRKFTATLHYDFATHHRRDRLPCDLKLVEDSKLSVLVWNSDSEVVLKKTYDLCDESCRITIVPQDVFQNRKRRWSKKYPIRVEVDGFVFFLFSDTSRNKEEWFRRLREAASGTTTQQLTDRLKAFFQYMQQYFLHHKPLRPSHTTRTASSSTATRTAAPYKHSQKKHKPEGTVQFSSGEDVEAGSVSISRSQSSQPGHFLSSISSSSSVFLSEPTPGNPSLNSDHFGGRPLCVSSVNTLASGLEAVATPRPSPLGPSHLETDWINALAARLCWDVWHEERWKLWIMSRIQKKLLRIKTPFMESLQLTDIAIGDKMPVINRLYEGPYVKMDGVWVYLDVTYEGLFVMTIKTKLKLGLRRVEEKGTEMKAISRHPVGGGSSSSGVVSHSQAAQVFQDSSVDPDDDSDTGSEDESTHTITHPLEAEALPPPPPPRKAAVLPTNKKKERAAKLKSVVSRITKKVASNRLVRRAAEKASSVPLELTVEVRKLSGILAVNIPPPPSDVIWYGFKETPKLELVAKPRLGQRAVTLSQITHLIERKLCSLVDEKLTLPNMEDLVIPILNSGLPEDTQKPLSSPGPNS